MQTFSPSFIPDLILLGLACGAFIIVAKYIFLFARLASRRPPLVSPLLRHDTLGRSFHNANAPLQEAMLARAVKEQQTVPPGWRSSQPRTLENGLKPRPLAAINNPPSAAYKNPLKRTASQASGASQEVNRSKLSRSSSGVVGKLHENVYFDENDFDDDDTLDLNDSVANHDFGNIQYPTLPLPAPKTYPTPNARSSQPIPWSSSPTDHYRKPTPSTSDISSYQHAPPASIQSSSLPNDPKPSKRRTIPWNNQHEKEASSNPALNVKDQAVVRQNTVKSTPASKAKSDSPYPWNKTASAVKEEQKRLRQGHRKLVKDHEAEEQPKSTRTKAEHKVPRVFLSDEQKKVFNLVTEERKSVFFTGSAGTGKSVLLREIIKGLRDKNKFQPERVAVTASTGLAACNIGGVTLHSFAGIGLGKEAVPELAKKIKRNGKAKKRWLLTKTLIVDEVSMVDGDLFDKLENIARIIRNNGRPFGGIQLVITGDFFQLPPVPDQGKVAKFCFDAAAWRTSIEHTIGLTKVFRQKDPVFANMLNEMRLGRLTPTSINAFRALGRDLSFDDAFEATELFPTRQEVDNANNNRMKSLSGRAVDFRADDGGSIQDVAQREKLLANCMAPPTISLKRGAQVMLIKNIDETLVNGSVGKVVAFMDERTFDLYHEDEDKFQASVDVDINDEDLSESRRKLKSMINKDLVGDTAHRWPLVRFAVAGGATRDLLCQKEQWKIELPNGEVQAYRTQVPLILAWALSIHKAQGQTLERVKVDLGKIFEKGQAYVALSRATCQEGLQIVRFDPAKVMAHDRVRGFYNSLYSIDDARKRSQGQKEQDEDSSSWAAVGDPWEADEDVLWDIHAGR